MKNIFLLNFIFGDAFAHAALPLHLYGSRSTLIASIYIKNRPNGRTLWIISLPSGVASHPLIKSPEQVLSGLRTFGFGFGFGFGLGFEVGLGS